MVPQQQSAERKHFLVLEAKGSPAAARNRQDSPIHGDEATAGDIVVVWLVRVQLWSATHMHACKTYVCPLGRGGYTEGHRSLVGP